MENVITLSASEARHSLGCSMIHLAVYIYIYGKAVATDFEVVRPGSGCGLFNVGVICSM